MIQSVHIYSLPVISARSERKTVRNFDNPYLNPYFSFTVAPVNIIIVFCMKDLPFSGGPHVRIMNNYEGIQAGFSLSASRNTSIAYLFFLLESWGLCGIRIKTVPL